MNPVTNFAVTPSGMSAVTKNMNGFDSAVVDTKADEVAAEKAYVAAKAELATQVKMDVITNQWKTDAGAAFGVINPLVKDASTGYEKKLADATALVATKKGLYDAALSPYTLEIAKQTYKDAVLAAEDGTNPDNAGTPPTVAAGYTAIVAKRDLVTPLTATLGQSVIALATARGTLATKEADVVTKQGLLEVALSTCEAK